MENRREFKGVYPRARFLSNKEIKGIKEMEVWKNISLPMFGHTNPQTWGGIYVSDSEELLKKIEELRLNMVNIKDDKPFTHPELLAASQELDTVLNKHQETLIKKNKKDG